MNTKHTEYSSNKRYLWVDDKGKFSESWSEEDHKKYLNEDDLNIGKKDGWKLIEFIGTIKIS